MSGLNNVMKANLANIICVTILFCALLSLVSCERKTVYYDTRGDDTDQIDLKIDSNLICLLRFTEFHTKMSNQDALALEYHFIESGGLQVENFSVEIKQPKDSRFRKAVFFQTHNISTNQNSRYPDFKSADVETGDEDFILKHVFFNVDLKEYRKFDVKFQVDYSYNGVTKEFIEVREIVRKRITVPIDL